jgi:aminoglycoside phosphotransferase family enzyme
MSFVFLTKDRVYKLKKPISRPPLDLTTLAAREFNCLEEVRLNRRLAPELYLGAMALTCSASGRLALGGSGEIVDWLVVMRRLPEDLMLERLLAQDGLAEAEVDNLADLLASFYLRVERPKLSPEVYLDRVIVQHRLNLDVLKCPFPNFDRDYALRIGAHVDRAIQVAAPLLRARAGEGALVDGHGDLRPEHVCFNHPIVIFDCLEFSAELRTIDPFDELAYLALECSVLVCQQVPASQETALRRSREPSKVGRIIRAGDFGPLLIAKVATRLGQQPPAALLHIYTALRAELRARLALTHLLDAHPREPEKWAPLAALYLASAEKSLGCLDAAMA